MFTCDIQNAFLTAPCREKLYTVAGPEFGSDEGKIMIVVRALYGLKSAGATFRAFLGEHLYGMGFRSCEADPDVWLRPAFKPNEEKYYEMILCYVDDVLAISESPVEIIRSIQGKFKLKGNKFGPPTDYLGAQLSTTTNANGTECWIQSAENYVVEPVKNVEQFLQSKDRSLPTRLRTPMRSDNKPELDTLPELAA
jgi:Reverse transcriptase (RNA-dependent DNA polymerase)